MSMLGQSQKTKDLRKEIEGSAGVQSYLFAGPRAIGKFQAALWLAQELVGESDFQASEELPYPADVLVLEPQTVTKGERTKIQGISVEMVREAIQFLSRYPSKGKYRILIIRDAHILSHAAQNMILKTLEEPATSALLILVTHEPGALLATVRSRVSEKVFQPVNQNEMKDRYSDEWLKTHSIPAFFRDLGRPGILEAAIRMPAEFQAKKDLLKSLYTMSQLSAKERLSLAENLSKDVPQAVELLEWWVGGLRSQVENLSQREKKKQFYRFLQSILEVIEALKTTQGNARLQLEQLFFQIR